MLGLVGERGREVREMVEDVLGAEGLSRSVVVAATSDAPAAVRFRSAQVATAIAEWFARVDGRRVLLLVDSLTRFARAIREVGLAAGEPPVRQGYPSRVFSELPRLLERAGTGPGGPITAVYTVLSTGDSAEDPLSAGDPGAAGWSPGPRPAHRRGRADSPPSTCSPACRGPCPPSPVRRTGRPRRAFVRAMARWESARDLIAAGAWVRGADAELDEAVAAMPAIEAFLRQEDGGSLPFGDTVRDLAGLASGIGA